MVSYPVLFSDKLLVFSLQIPITKKQNRINIHFAYKNKIGHDHFVSDFGGRLVKEAWTERFREIQLLFLEM